MEAEHEGSTQWISKQDLGDTSESDLTSQWGNKWLIKVTQYC